MIDCLTDCRSRLIRDSFAAAAAVLINVLQSVNALSLLLRHCTSYFFFIEPIHYCIHYLLDRRARHFTMHVVYNVLLTSIISFLPFLLFIDLCFCCCLRQGGSVLALFICLFVSTGLRFNQSSRNSVNGGTRAKKETMIFCGNPDHLAFFRLGTRVGWIRRIESHPATPVSRGVTQPNRPFQPTFNSYFCGISGLGEGMRSTEYQTRLR